jgi:DNA recombination protein RmuC
MTAFDWLLLALAALNLLLLIALLLQRGAHARLDRLERELRDELARAASAGRQELGQGLAALQQTLLAQSGDALRTQNEQVDAMRIQLGQLQQALTVGMSQASATLAEQLGALSLANERRLAALQDGNEKKLDQMRATVDEKLHATLEQRLGESFKQVADRLEQVHKGLGEMQTLARDVGSLNRVLTNVKTRGIFGEVQLGNLLEQVLTPEQYAKNVETVPGSNERVEFAGRCGCRSTPNSRATTTSACSTRRSAPTSRRSRSPRVPSRCACAPRRARSARSTSRRRTRQSSRSCSCLPRACTPKRCADRA